MISDLIGREFAGGTADDEISAGSASNLVRHMRRYMELPIVPAKSELVSSVKVNKRKHSTYPFRMQVDVFALRVRKKVCRTFYKGNGSGAIIAEEDVEQSSTTDNAGQILVGCPLRQVGDEDGTLVVNRDLV